MRKKNNEKSWQNHSGRIVYQKKDEIIIDCKTCGFKHFIPIPDGKQLDSFYSKSFYKSLWSDYISNHIDEHEWRKLEYNEKCDVFENLLPNKEQRKLLDIGSGPGLFMMTAVNRGWTAVGIEPGKEAWQYSTSELHLTVYNVCFNEENYSQFGAFHVVNMNNVLEHLPYPQKTMSFIHQILEPDGLVCITVPNDFNPLQEAGVDYYRKDEWWVSIQEHINYFDQYSLENFLKASGLEPVYQTSSFPLELFLLMGDDYVKDETLGKAIHEKRKRFEMNMDRVGKAHLTRNIYTSLNKLGIGREITVIARKKSLES